MIHITLYACTADNRQVDKTNYLTSVITGTAVFYENSSIVAPVIKFDWGGSFNSNVNYVYIQEFNRWYYITDVRALIGGSVEYSLRCDVLMTYKGTIYNSTQTVSRSESIGKPTMITDDFLPIAPYRDVKVVLFEGGYFNLHEATSLSYNFILNVAGGGSGQQ